MLMAKKDVLKGRSIVRKIDATEHSIDELLKLKVEELEDLKIPDIEEPEPAFINLNIIAEEYHKNINNIEATLMLEKFGITTPEILSRFMIGYSNRSMIEKLSDNQKKELVNQGILSGDETETLAGCLTIPLYDNDASTGSATVIGIVGLKEDGSTVLVGDSKIVWNLKASKVYDEIIFTDRILSGLSLSQTGINNIIAVEGLVNLPGNGIIELKNNRVKTVSIFFENQQDSNLLKEMLLIDDFKVKQVFPAFTGSWNEELIKGMNRESIEFMTSKAEVFRSTELKENFKVTKDNTGIVFTIGELTYRLNGVKDMFVTNLKVNIRAEYNGEWFPDNLDLYSSRSRNAFSTTLSTRFNVEPKKIEKDLLAILDYLEKERNKRLAVGGNNEKIELTEEERRIGLEFLRSPNMFDLIVRDMETLGYVGEDLNKQLLYLCASSRILDDPISVLILSQSASGKSMLVETVRKLLPPEDVIAITSLSDQALNYITDLSHRFLVFGEAVHNETIEHQIREMLSSKELSRLVTVKDEKTGKMHSEVMRKPVIVSAVMSSTNYRINPENLSRFFVINADESREQTKRIHEIQKKKYTLERIAERKEKIPTVVKKHQAAQRMLNKYAIVNPFGLHLDFPDNLMRTRRDHDRFIDLIAVVCFLRQYQKEIKTRDEIRYIECDLEDYSIARNITVNSILTSTLGEFPKTLVDFYEELRIITRKNAKDHNLPAIDVSFDFREVRDKIKWIGSETIKKYLRMLVNYEYLLLSGGGNRGQRNKYRLLDDQPMEKLDLSMIPTVEEIKIIIENKSTNIPKSRTSG